MRIIKKIIVLLVTMVLIISLIPTVVSASNEKTEVSGKVYEFDKDSKYEFHEDATYVITSTDNTYGTFYITGDIVNTSNKSGVTSYEVAEGNLTMFYNYGDMMLNADEDSWHLIEDKSNKVGGMTLNSNIMKGTILLQTSKDKKNWVDVETIYNAFSDTPIRTSSIYSTTDVQLINGSYYRMIVVYETAIRTEKSNILFINTDKYDYKKFAEVYEFYAFINSGEADVIDTNQTFSLGDKVRVDNFDGYYGGKTINKDDIHYGWDIGNFFVSGYTDEVTDSDGNMVFLKNIGDKVTLWFNLKQNIKGINGQENLTITADTEGYDQYFETPKMNFGRGALIIRYTDHNNVKVEPTIYTNYLEANVAIGANTKVQLFEEGDYEVALDYEVTKDEFIDKIGHYRIFFKFSVRNGNCMVYPFDVKTGSELTNSSMTENGFRLDLAKSRYLKINIKREVLKDSADGLVEDTRSNGPARDGAEYTEEGIYTITVNNTHTGQFTTKKIYVGKNDVLRAYMTTGLSIPEINNLLLEGASINDDGTIQFPVVESEDETLDEPVIEETDVPQPSDEEVVVNNEIENNQLEEAKENQFPTVAVIIFIIACIAVVAVVFYKKINKNNSLSENKNDKGDVE